MTNLNTAVSITMEDGRAVQFRSGQFTHRGTYLFPDGTMLFEVCFRNGRIYKIPVPQGDLYRFAALGIEQKFGSCIQRDSYEKSVEALNAMRERLEKGQWNVRGSGIRESRHSSLARALNRITGRSLEDIRSFLSTLSQGDKLAMRKLPEVAAMLDQMQGKDIAKRKLSEAQIAETALKHLMQAKDSSFEG